MAVPASPAPPGGRTPSHDAMDVLLLTLAAVLIIAAANAWVLRDD